MASLRTSSYNFSDYLNLLCSNSHFIYCFSRNELYTLLFNVARPEHRKSKKLREKSKFQTNELRFKISQAIHVQRTENRSCIKIQFWKNENQFFSAMLYNGIVYGFVACKSARIFRRKPKIVKVRGISDRKFRSNELYTVLQHVFIPQNVFRSNFCLVYISAFFIRNIFQFRFCF